MLLGGSIMGVQCIYTNKVHVSTKFYNSVLPMPGLNKMQILSASGLNIRCS